MSSGLWLKLSRLWCGGTCVSRKRFRAGGATLLFLPVDNPIAKRCPVVRLHNRNARAMRRPRWLLSDSQSEEPFAQRNFHG